MVSPITVRQWSQKGLLPARTTPGGHRRYLRDDVERFAKSRGINLRMPGSEQLRVLIVDDEPAVASLVSELITGLSQPVVTEIAYDGFEAGMKLLGFQPDVVLLDLVMLGLDGFEVCRRIKSEPNNRLLRVIAMTGFRTPENVERILAAGAECCLAKPFDEQQLLDVLGLGSGAGAEAAQA